MSWIEIRQLGPISGRIQEIMTAVYLARDLPVPGPMDDRYPRGKVHYQVDPEATEPTIAIINLVEGLRSLMKTHFMINLNTWGIHDKFANIRFRAPDAISNALEEVHNHIRTTVILKKEDAERTRKADEKRAAMAKEAAEHRRKTEAELAARRRRAERVLIKDFYNRLVDNELLDHNAIPRKASRFCPLCIDRDSESDSSSTISSPHRLAQCSRCKILLCMNSECSAFAMDFPAQCFSKHANHLYCSPCRGEGEDANLLKCPSGSCPHWLCDEDRGWCVGRPQTAKTSKSKRPAKKRKVEPSRLHEKKLSPCEQCVEFVVCDRSSCWSKGIPHGLVCDECTPNNGLECECENTWICDDCHENSTDTIWPCPNCDTGVCRKCEKAEECSGCEKEWCKGCQEGGEFAGFDESVKVGIGWNDSEVRKFTWACPGEDCDEAFCKQCVDGDHEIGKLIGICNTCEEEYCISCAHYDTCESCGSDICYKCANGELGEACSECGPYGFSTTQLQNDADMYHEGGIFGDEWPSEWD